MLFLWAVESRQKELSLCVACGSCGDKAVAARGYLQYRCFGEGSPWHFGGTGVSATASSLDSSGAETSSARHLLTKLCLVLCLLWLSSPHLLYRVPFSPQHLSQSELLSLKEDCKSHFVL